MTPQELVVAPSAPMPKGYGFLKKGDVYLTGLCRRKTHAIHKTLYVVKAGRSLQGLRAPRHVISEVLAEDRATRHQRQAVVERRDDATRDAFSKAIKRLFPQIPETDLEQCVSRTLQKRSGRVGRTGKITIDEKARLAVAAHARHRHTEYEALLRGKKAQGEARKEVYPVIRRVLREWGGVMPERPRKSTSQSRTRGHQAGTKRTNNAPHSNTRKKSRSADTRKHQERKPRDESPEIIDLTEDTGPEKPRPSRCPAVRTRATTRSHNKPLGDLEMLDEFFDDSEENEDGDDDDELNGPENDLDAYSDDFELDGTDEEDSGWDWLDE